MVRYFNEKVGIRKVRICSAPKLAPLPADRSKGRSIFSLVYRFLWIFSGAKVGQVRKMSTQTLFLPPSSTDEKFGMRTLRSKRFSAVWSIALFAAVLGGCSLSQRSATTGKLHLSIPASLSARFARSGANRKAVPIQAAGVTTGAVASEESYPFDPSGFFLLSVDGPGIAKGPYAQNACVHLTDQTSFFLNLQPKVDQTFDLSVPVGSDRTVRLYYVLPSIPARPYAGQPALDFLMQLDRRGEDLNPSMLLLIASTSIGNLSGDQEVDLYLKSQPEWMDCSDGVPPPPPPISNAELRLSSYSPWNGFDDSFQPRPLRYWSNSLRTFYLTFEGDLQNQTGDALNFSSPTMASTILNPSPSPFPSGTTFYVNDLIFNHTPGLMSLASQQKASFAQHLKLSLASSGQATTDLWFDHALKYSRNLAPDTPLQITRPIQISVLEQDFPLAIGRPTPGAGKIYPTPLTDVFQIPVYFSKDGNLSPTRGGSASSLNQWIPAATPSAPPSELLTLGRMNETTLYSVTTVSEVTHPLALAISPQGIAAVIDEYQFKLILQDLTAPNASPSTLANVRACLVPSGTSCDPFGSPSALAFSPDGGKLYIADLHANQLYPGTIRVLDVGHGVDPLPSPIPIITSGIGGATFTPSGLLQVGSTLYVSDRANHVIYSVDLTAETKALSVFAGKLSTLGNADGDCITARFNSPEGLSLAGDPGNPKILVADANNEKIRIIDVNLNTVSTMDLTSDFSGHPTMAVRGQDGMIYIANQSRPTIQRFDPVRSVLTDIAGKPNQHDKVDGYAEEAMFNKPTTIVPFQGSFFVLDLADSSSTVEGGIRKVSPLPSCPHEANPSKGGWNQKFFAQGTVCTVTTAIFSKPGTDQILLELQVESNGNAGISQQSIPMPDISGGSQFLPPIYDYDLNKTVPIEFQVGNNTYFSGSQFSLVQARVSNGDESRLLTEFPDPSGIIRLSDFDGLNPQTISIARKLNDKAMRELEVVVLGTLNHHNVLQRLRLHLNPTSDPGKP